MHKFCARCYVVTFLRRSVTLKTWNRELWMTKKWSGKIWFYPKLRCFGSGFEPLSKIQMHVWIKSHFLISHDLIFVFSWICLKCYCSMNIYSMMQWELFFQFGTRCGQIFVDSGRLQNYISLNFWLNFGTYLWENTQIYSTYNIRSLHVFELWYGK